MPYAGNASYDDRTYAHPLDLVSLAEALGFRFAPVASMIGIGSGGACKDTTIHWNDWYVVHHTDTINEGAPYAAGDLTLTVADGTKFRTGFILLIDDEVLLVTNVAANNLTVTRGYGGTTDAEHADGSTVTIIGRPRLEGEAYGTPVTRAPAELTNYTQIFRRDVNVSNTEGAVQHIAMPFGSDMWGNRVRMAFEEMLPEMEYSFLNGYKASSAPQGSSTVRRTFGGCRQFVTNTLDAGAAALNLDTHIEAAVQDCYEGGGRPDLFVFSPRQARKFSSLMTAYRQMQAAASEFGNMISVYDTAFGWPIYVLATPALAADEVLLIDRAKMEIPALRSWQEQPPTRQGDNLIGIVVGEYSVKIYGGSTHHIRIHNLATA